jgi:hypothetical protein
MTADREQSACSGRWKRKNTGITEGNKISNGEEKLPILEFLGLQGESDNRRVIYSAPFEGKWDMSTISYAPRSLSYAATGCLRKVNTVCIVGLLDGSR